MDSLLTFTTCHQYQEILSLCHLVVNTRPNYSIDKLSDVTRALLSKHQATDINQLKTSTAGKIYFANKCFFDISSTHIRQRLTQQQACNHQLLPSICEFIHKNKLYR